MRAAIRNILYTFAGLAGLFLGGTGYFFMTLPDVTDLKAHSPGTTAMIEYRKAEAAEMGKPLKIRWKWIPLAQVPRELLQTIIIAEDGAFWVHEGVDWDEVENALRDKLEQGKRLRGASTITQQTAKNLFLSPERSVLRKIREFFIARDLEKELGKRRILEIYVNIIELGPGIFGIASAAEIYFGKTVAGLSRGEMIRLAAVIPDPLDLHPGRGDGNLKWRCREILRRLQRHNWITPEAYEQAHQELNHFFGEDILQT